VAEVDNTASAGPKEGGTVQTALTVLEGAPHEKLAVGKMDSRGRGFESRWPVHVQIITVEHGRFRNWACGFKTVLATGDGGLANAPNKKDCASGIV
jgi:hypothetical protein